MQDDLIDAYYVSIKNKLTGQNHLRL